MAFPSAIGFALDRYTGTPTMNININFTKLAREGEWLVTEASCDRIARTAAFLHGSLVGLSGEVHATATGVFKISESPGRAKEFKL